MSGEKKSLSYYYGLLCIFVLGIPTSCNQLVAPVAKLIAADFPDMTVTMVGLLTSMPSLAMIVSLFVSSWLVTKIDRKKIILIGLILCLLGGLGPIMPFVTSGAVVLAFRFVFGLGTGLIAPLAATYIAQYPEAKRSKIVGVNQFVASAGGAIIILVAGTLIPSGWRIVSLVHLILLLFIITTFTGLKTTGPIKAKAAPEASSDKPIELPKTKLPAYYFFGIAGAVILTMAYIGLTSYMATYTTSVIGETGAQLTSTAMSVGRIVGALGCLLVPILMRVFKEWVTVIGALVGALAIVLYTIPNQITILIGYCLIYLASIIACVPCTVRNTTMLPLPRVAFAMSILNVLLFAGQFASAPMMVAISNMIQMDLTQAGSYYALLVPIGIILILNLPIWKKRKAA